jgi:hypothetical protein
MLIGDGGRLIAPHAVTWDELFPAERESGKGGSAISAGPRCENCEDGGALTGALAGTLAGASIRIKFLFWCFFLGDQVICTLYSCGVSTAAVR